MSILETDAVYVIKHDSLIEPTGEHTPGGLIMPRFEYLNWISDRYDAGENVQDMIIVKFDTMQLIWDRAMETGDFSQLSDDFFDSLAAIEVLIQRERVVERYVKVFGEKPKSILSLKK